MKRDEAVKDLEIANRKDNGIGIQLGTSAVCGLLAERLSRMKPYAICRSDLDDIIIALRRAEADLLELSDTVRWLQSGEPKAHAK